MFLGAAEAGESAGQRNRQLSDEELESLKRDQLSQQQMGMQGDEQAASLALKRDELGLQAQQQQAGQRQAQAQQAATMQAAAASLALKQQQQQSDAMQTGNQQAIDAARVLQSGDLGQERANNTAQRNSDLAGYNLGRLKDAADLLALRKQIADTPKVNNAVTVKTATGNTLKMTKEEYSAYEQALAKWKASEPPKTKPGMIWGQNDNPADKTYLAQNPEPQPQDFIGGGAAPASAAAALQAPASTRTNAPASTPSYATATNPDTGEQMIYKDGQWQPLTTE
jgi:hypothetical protein